VINNGNINVGNRVHVGGNNFAGNNFAGNHAVGNRPNWDRPNWNNPGWGWGGSGGWAGNWHNHAINPRYGWYNGAWNGYWGSNWYAPLAWGAVGWGLGSLTSGWGYGSSYYNPYYALPAAAASAPYDYSQPVVVNNNYVASDADAPPDATVQAAPPAEDPATQQAADLFDGGLAQFKAGQYREAVDQLDAALQKLPGDPVVHEVRALALFALGEYQQAAAALNSFLSSAPGMDWTTLSSLYGNTEDYQAQLRKLEQFCGANRNDAAAYFVLAYQYLVIGSKDAAIKALKMVVRDQPQDITAKRMLDALAPAPAATAPPLAATAEPQGGETDLVGDWRATSAGTTVDLSITEDSQFNWKATQAGKPPVALTGELASSGDEIVLGTKEQGSMAGTVKSWGPDKWQFALSGAPSSDAGLSFDRVRKQ
jgi:tetratricopeptide (TPR) repeat protein